MTVSPDNQPPANDGSEEMEKDSTAYEVGPFPILPSSFILEKLAGFLGRTVTLSPIVDAWYVRGHDYGELVASVALIAYQREGTDEKEYAVFTRIRLGGSTIGFKMQSYRGSSPFGEPVTYNLSEDAVRRNEYFCIADYFVRLSWCLVIWEYEMKNERVDHDPPKS